MEILKSPTNLRACRRLLQSLATPGARLTPVEGSPAYVLRSVSAAPKAANLIPAETIRFLAASDVVEAEGGDFKLSAAGRAWLARQEAAPSDRFAAQHQLRTIRKTASGDAVIMNDAESPLAWLRSRKDKNGAPMITEYQYQAGERLRADFEHGAMNARVTANWSNPTSGSGRRGAPRDPAAFSDIVIAARQRYGRAIEAAGPEMAKMLIDVCCHMRGLEDAERGAGWPKRSGKVVLQIALTMLARHYGLLNDTPRSPHRSAPQHWGAPDYRPHFDG